MAGTVHAKRQAVPELVYCGPFLEAEELGDFASGEIPEQAAQPSEMSYYSRLSGRFGYGFARIGFPAERYSYGYGHSHERSSQRKRRTSRRPPKKKVHKAAEKMQAAKDALAKLFANPHDAVMQFTKSIFDGDIGIETVVDPETGTESIQVKVEAAGTVDKLLALNDRWHRELAQLENAGNYCLLLVPRDEST